MRKLLLIGLVGLAAQLVDGALGMGYGITSSSLLLLAGLTPAAASASVHVAELGANLASGTSDWRLGNVDKRILWGLGVPGAVGAFAGATFLSWISTELAKPVMGVLLVSLGIYVLVRFTVRPPTYAHSRPHGRRFLVPLGLLGGFVDATGGGGWGPISTSTLLSAGRTEPRTVVGSVSASELLVTIAASVGFIAGLGLGGVQWPFAAALLIGGVIAAPVAAWLVTKVPASVLGVAVGGLIITTNLHLLLEVLGLRGGIVGLLTAAVATGWAGHVAWAVWRHRRTSTVGERTQTPAAT